MEKLQPIIDFLTFCVEHDVQTVICRPFWASVVVICDSLAIIVLIKCVYSAWQWHRNAKAVELRRQQALFIDAAAIQDVRWRGEDEDVLLGQAAGTLNLATAIRASLDDRKKVAHDARSDLAV